MFDWIHNQNWKGSPAHLLLLSKFTGGDSPERYRDAEYWAAVLRESPLTAIDRFLAEGILEPAGPAEALDFTFKASDLKQLARSIGLKVSGKKSELIRRLIENAPEEVCTATQGVVIYRCTPLGAKVADGFVQQQKAWREHTEQQSYYHLTRGEIFLASTVVAQFEAQQVFPRGMGVDWRTFDTHLARSLAFIFQRTPAILHGIETIRLNQLRLAAGMMDLWGTGTARKWLPAEFETGTRLDSDSACRMFVFHASFLRNMQQLQELGVKRVEILGCGDSSCPQCRRLNGKKFRISDVPELPYAECTCDIGCRCTAITAY